MSRFGARNGAPDSRRGMQGRNDSAIRRARSNAKMRGHTLKRGTVAPATNNHAELWYAWCPCGCAVVVEDGLTERGSALRQNCESVS